MPAPNPAAEGQISPLEAPPPPARIEAETLTVQSGFVIGANGTASGRSILQATGSGLQRASAVFQGPTGVYDIALRYYDENDGVARLGLRVDGVAVDAFLWDEATSSAFADAGSARIRTIGQVFVENGEIVEIFGFQNAGEPLRVDYLEFTYVAPAPTSAAPVNAAPASATVTTGQTLAFTGPSAVSVSDADSARVTTTLAVTNGALSLGSTSAAVIVTDGGASATISGSSAAVNAALAGLTFTPTAGFVGNATLTVRTSDGGSTDTDAVAIAVQPFGDPNAEITVTPREPGVFGDRLVFNWIDEPATNASTPRDMKESGVVRVQNDGTGPLAISRFELDGPFTVANPALLTNRTLAPGEFVDVRVDFNRAVFQPRINNESGVFNGALRIFSNDVDENVTTIKLAGFWQRIDEGSWEANLNEIFEVMGFGNRIPGLPFRDDVPSPIFNFGRYEAYDENEVLSPHWRIADGFTEATITTIGRWSGPGVNSVVVHRPFSKSQTAVKLDGQATDTQMILPERAGTSTVGTGGALDPLFASARFTSLTIPDGWNGPDYFAFAAANYSTDVHTNFDGGIRPANAPPEDIYGHFMRMWRALDANGNVIPHTYIGTQDFAGINSDHNDNVFVVTGVTPVSLPPVTTAPAAVTVAEDSSIAFTGARRISVADPNDIDSMTPVVNVFLFVGNGALSIGAPGAATVTGNGTETVRLTGSLAAVNGALASLVYTPRPDFDGADQLRIVANDRALADTDIVAITVTPGNDDAPVVSSASSPAVTTAGGVTTTVTVVYADDVGLALGSIDAGDVTVLDPQGVALTVTGVTVTPGGGGKSATAVYTVAARGGAWDGTDNGSYRVLLDADEVFDTNGSAATAREIGGFTVSVPLPPATRVEAESLQIVSGFSAVNSTVSSGGRMLQANGSGEQRARMTFDGAEGLYRIGVGHFDENDGAAQMRVLVNGVEVGSWVWDLDLGSAFAVLGTRTVRSFTDIALRPGDIVEIAGFQNAGEPLRTDFLEFQFQSGLVAGAVAPVNRAPAAVTVAEDGVFAFTGANAVSVSDANGGSLTTTLTTTGGSLAVATGAGATVTGSGTGSVVVSGSIAQVNAALAGLSFAPAANFFGPTSVRIATSDGALTDVDTVAVTVTAVNDAPTAGPTTASTGVGQPVTFTLPFGDVDNNLQSLIVTPEPVSARGGAVSYNGDGTVTYVPAPGFSGSDSFTYVVTDPGGLSSGVATVTVDVTAAPPPAAFRVEAESFALVQGMAVSTNGAASGGRQIQATGSAEAVARHVFAGAAGTWDLDLGYFDETDGQASLRVLVNGTQIDSFLWDRPTGDAFASTASRAVRAIDGVALAPGDVIELRGFANAGEPLRIDFLDFAFA